MPVLTGIDVLKVQSYIFSSNKLGDVVSASWLVDWATAKDGALRNYQDKIVFSAGANALLEFECEDEAKDFAGKYTRSLLETTPGLIVALVHHPYMKGNLASAIREIQVKLARFKTERVPSAAQLGLGITARCQITGLPANGVSSTYDDSQPVSATVLSWRKDCVRKKARDRWQEFLPKDKINSLQFPLDIDKMGRTFGETSLIGVVHIDGNGMAMAIQKWLRECVESRRADAEVRKQYDQWSSDLNLSVKESFQTALGRLFSSIEGGTVHAVDPKAKFPLFKEENCIYIPLRPIILGGDDLTFLCDGRIALDLAALILSAFEHQTIPYLGKISACAGVAIVRSHHPFSRAYEMAEQLCASAKAKRREEGDSGSWIDWHIGSVEPGSSIAAMRRRTYVSDSDGNLKWMTTCRPYRLGVSRDDTESWRWLSETVLGAQSCGFRSLVWKERRNKVKELLLVAYEGPDSVLRTLEAWRVSEPNIGLAAAISRDGYLDRQRTPLMDAIEVLDIHTPLATDGNREGGEVGD